MMNWTEQAEAMMNSLAEAQKKAWEGWYDLTRNQAAGQPGFSSNLPDPFQFFKQGFDAWSAGGGASPSAADQIFAGQRSLLNMMELLTQTWRTVAPKMESGQNWEGELRKLINPWLNQLMGHSGDFMKPGLDGNEMWQSFINNWSPLMKSWLEAAQKMLQGQPGIGLPGDLNKFFNLEANDLSRMFGSRFGMAPMLEHMADMPRLGYTGEHNAKIMRAYNAYVDLNKVIARYRDLLTRAMGDALKQTMNKLAELAKKGDSIASIRELHGLWLSSADEVFSHMYVSPEYIDVQKEMSRTGLKFKAEQRQVMEMFMRSLDMPTRSELDDAYKTLYTLRKEVKALKKALAEPPATQRRSTPARRKAASKKTTRKTAAKKSAAKKKTRRRARG